MYYFWSHLSDRAVVSVSGVEATDFLHRLLTINVKTLPPHKLSYGALLTPQGKVLFDFLLQKRVGPEGALFYIDLPSGDSEELIERLSFYRLHARVNFLNHSESLKVFAFWKAEDESGAIVSEASESSKEEGRVFPLPGAALQDPRLPSLGWRLIAADTESFAQSPALRQVPLSAYHTHRIHFSVPESAQDFSYEEIFPHHAWMDVFRGIDFKKGCYVGQEVVARMAHKHAIRRRFLSITSSHPLSQGMPIIAQGHVIGKMGSIADTKGLALLRLDHWRNAIESGHDLTCGEIPITAAFPEWVPEAVQNSERAVL